MSVAYFQLMGDEGLPFIIRLEDDALIAHARALVAGTATNKARVQGTIVKTSATYNPGWAFHLDPKSIGFFDLAMEVCDANPVEIENHLDEVGGSFLPGGHWCPWALRVKAEVSPA